jgi:hypothetical protein
VQLERVSVQLRPRAPWEAIDLGFRMAQVWWRPLFGAWLALALPLCALLGLVFSERLWLAALVLWWLEPLLERLPLYVASEALFGHMPSVAETLRAAPRLLARQGLWAVTLRRLSPVRSFVQPVVVLEDLEPRAQRERIRTLRWRAGGAAALLTLVCFGFEVAVIAVGLVASALWFAPESTGIGLEAFLAGELSPAWYAGPSAAFALAVLGIGPFYAAAGFSLYIHRRIYLEGWDVELAFRALSRRAAGAAGRVLAGLVLVSAPLAAASPSDPSEAHDVIARIYAEPELRGWVEVETWVRVGRSPEEEQTLVDAPEWLVAFAEWLAGGLRIGLWIGLAVLAALLLRWLARLAREPPAAAANARSAPELVAGFDVRPEGLPTDVIAAARSAWSQGRARDALALLYRAALVHLVTARSLDVGPGATEGEVLRRVRPLGEVAAPFARLTRAWQGVAYARRAPEGAVFDGLCDEWAPYLGRQ